MKAVYIVDDANIAKVLVDPMRRAILDLLRTAPMTQAKLADELGLSNASLSYHMKALRSAKLVIIDRRERESHGLMQKFFLPAAYLFVYDLNKLPKDIGRYFYPVSLERTRGIVSALLNKNSKRSIELNPETINKLTVKLSNALIVAAKRYRKAEAIPGSESIVYDIYSEAIKIALG